MTTHRPAVEVGHLFHGAFGADSFGRRAEAFARFFGTPIFLIGQTIIVGIWVLLNAIGITHRWDPYPFILLNLAFSLQAAYAAPLILLAQTRQADRDKVMNDTDSAHRESIAADTLTLLQQASHQNDQIKELLEANTRLTEQVNVLTLEIHSMVVKAS